MTRIRLRVSRLRSRARRLRSRASRARERAARASARAAGWLGEQAARPPPGPFRPDYWRSPLRGLRLTSVLGAVLLAGLAVIVVTGLLSYAAYDPRLPGNDQTPGAWLLKFYLFTWPAGPSWLYRLNQALHVLVGLALVPVVLLKLWSVLPRLFSWPPVRSVAHALERLSLILVVGGVLFEFATGILDIQNYYVFPFSFYTGHLYGAWVLIAGLAVHVTLKFPRMLAGLRSRGARRRPRTLLGRGRPQVPVPDDLRAPHPAPATISRRGLLAATGGASLTLAGLAAGQSIGGTARRTALLAPRGGTYGRGPNDFPVNRTAASVGLDRADTRDGYRLVLAGRAGQALTRAHLLTLPLHSAVLPIACVEGWSTQEEWTGVRLTDLARLAGVSDPGTARVRALEHRSPFPEVTLSAEQVRDPRTLLALRVNGADLSLNHGYPARIIVPAAPGVHNTKWVTQITFAGRA